MVAIREPSASAVHAERIDDDPSGHALLFPHECARSRATRLASSNGRSATW
jgi:hypothetical protein